MPGLLSALLFALASTPGPALDSAAPHLAPGRTLERRISGGEVHAYSLELQADELADVLVEQKGVDVILTLYEPGGKKLGESNSPNVSFGPEIFCFVTPSAGKYLLELTTDEPAAPAADYSIVLRALRPATDPDRRRFAAQSKLLEADDLQSQGPGDSLRKARTLYQEAAESFREIEDAVGEARALWGLSYAERNLGNLHAALPPLFDALSLQPRLRDPGFEAAVYNWIGLTYNSLGDRATAIVYFDCALALEVPLGELMGEGVTHSGRGLAQGFGGDLQGAMGSFLRALFSARGFGDRRAEGITLNSLALVYDLSGDTEAALEGYSNALRVLEEVGDRRNQGIALNNMGTVYSEKKEWRKAIEHHTRALALRRELGDRYGEAYSLDNLGLCHTQLGELSAAGEELSKALALRREVADRYGEGRTLHNLGELYARQGRPAEALEAYGQALERQRGTADLLGQADTLAGQARVLRDTGDLAGARRKAEEAMALCESQRALVASAQRATYLGSVRATYELEVDLLMRLHRETPDRGLDAEALHVSELSRARRFVELLDEAHADIRQGVDEHLLEQERSLRRSLASKLEEQTRLSGSDRSASQAAQVAKMVDQLAAELQHLESQIRAASPRYADLIRPEVPAVGQIRELLDGETVLLEYALGDERSYVWAVTREGLSGVELPGREEVESAARSLYAEWAVRRPEAAAGAGSDAAMALSRLLLGPIAAHLDKSRVVVVADGALQIVPFGALPVPGGKAPLLRDHEIVNLPSAAVLAALRRERKDRAPAQKTVIVLADPVFDRSDTRLRAAASRLAGTGPGPLRPDGTLQTALTRSVRDFGDGESALPRLAFTRQEATAILASAPASSSRAALDFEASRTLAMSGELSRYRFVHFATHGLVDTVHPQLSGVVLSLLDREGRDQDGFLPAMEVFNLQLSADLVVLSACRTALGRDLRGEGIEGLTRAFMYAGAPRVVASLWQVDDAATAELMKRFYEGMLGPKKLRPAAALREAQLAVRAQKRWEHPYYWAGFVLEGEWK